MFCAPKSQQRSPLRAFRSRAALIALTFVCSGLELSSHDICAHLHNVFNSVVSQLAKDQTQTQGEQEE